MDRPNPDSSSKIFLTISPSRHKTMNGQLMLVDEQTVRMGCFRANLTSSSLLLRRSLAFETLS